MAKPKILIFSLAYHPFVGGAEVAVKEITDRLGDEFEFDLITANLDGRQLSPEQLGPVNVYRIKYRFKSILKYIFPWLAYRQAVVLHRQKNYDLIWAIMANQAGWAALKFKNKFPRTKFLLTLQEGDSEWDIWLRTFFIRPIYKNIYRRADRIQAISNFLARRAQRLGAKCPIVVVPNGVSTRNAQRVTRNAPNQKYNIITVSRLVKKNGITDLIKAINLLVTGYGLQVTLLIFGAGKLRNKLEKLVKDLNLTERVKFLGNVSNAMVYEHLSQADVFVRPSLSEGLGNAFLEAMAVGVPVVGTPVGGIPDFLREDETGPNGATSGWFCEVKNPQSIAAKVNYILDPKNQTEVQRVVANATALAQRDYRWDNIAPRLRDLINSLLK